MEKKKTALNAALKKEKAKSCAKGELPPCQSLPWTAAPSLRTGMPSASWLRQCACEQCDYTLSHKILSYSDFLAALSAQKGLVIDYNPETTVGITEIHHAPKTNSDATNE